jgi:hypothetical protein
VTASVDSIIRIVYVFTNTIGRTEYMRSLTWFKDSYFPWAYDQDIPVPDFGNHYRHAVDGHGV